MIDRTVHARYPGMEIVRYDRAGKWFLEPTDPALPRQRVTVSEAAGQAVWGSRHGGYVYFSLHGGAVFDRKALDHAAPGPHRGRLLDNRIH